VTAVTGVGGVVVVVVVAGALVTWHGLPPNAAEQYVSVVGRT